MRFQMSLELQENSNVTNAALKRVPNSRGSKMKWAFTGWLKVNLGNFEPFFQKLIAKRVVVDKCANQKTNMEEEYPRNDEKAKQPVCIEYEISKGASEAQWRWV